MVQWETSACFDTAITIHVKNEKQWNHRAELVRFLEAPKKNVNVLYEHQSLLSSCLKRAITLVLQLRISYRYNRLSRPIRDWTSNNHINKGLVLSKENTFLAPTIQDLLYAYVNSPPGSFHVSCECELRWYFKLIEDCITQTELETLNGFELTVDITLDVRNKSGILSLERLLERVVIVGAHSSSSVVAAGPRIHVCHSVFQRCLLFA